MNKKAVLTKEVIEIIMAAAGIFLVGLLFFRFLAPGFDKDLESAKSILKNIIEKADNLKEREIDNYPVMGMDGWSLIFFDKSLTSFPRECEFRKDCLCICKCSPRDSMENNKDLCNTKGVCKKVSNIKIVAFYPNQKEKNWIEIYDDSQPIKELFFKKSNGVFEIYEEEIAQPKSSGLTFSKDDFFSSEYDFYNQGKKTLKEQIIFYVNNYRALDSVKIANSLARNVREYLKDYGMVYVVIYLDAGKINTIYAGKEGEITDNNVLFEQVSFDNPENDKEKITVKFAWRKDKATIICDVCSEEIK